MPQYGGGIRPNRLAGVCTAILSRFPELFTFLIADEGNAETIGIDSAVGTIAGGNGRKVGEEPTPPPLIWRSIVAACSSSGVRVSIGEVTFCPDDTEVKVITDAVVVSESLAG
jgi:hypothetical protein